MDLDGLKASTILDLPSFDKITSQNTFGLIQCF